MNKRNVFSMAAVALASSMLLSSCATIVSGGDPSITIKGDVPEPVNITTEKQTYKGVTLPAVVEVKRKHLDGQRIKITSENYKFEDVLLQKQVNPWAFGNILLGGLIGWGVDLGTNCVVQPRQTEFSVTPIPLKKEEE